MSKQSSSISNSKKSILLVILKFLAYILALNLIFLVFILPAYSDCYSASILDKMNRLKSIEGPKIILVGNSNVCYGYRSEIIEDELGMPVVNLGLHASLGNPFHENMIKGYVGEGDIVVISHFAYGNDEKIGNPVVAWITIENHFDLWRLIQINQWPDLIASYPTYVKKCINRKFFSKNDEYEERKYFNEYGDYLYADYNDLHYDFPKDYVAEAPMISCNTIDRINNLNRYVKEQGAILLIAGYPIAFDEKDMGLDERFASYENEMKKAFDCEYISNFTDYLYPYEDFCDSSVHLRTDAAKKRSLQLVEDINHHFAK